MVQALLRFYSYLLHVLVSLFALGVGLVAALSENKSFTITMLPWSDSTLQTALLLMGVVGLISVYLAFQGKIRILFLLWTVVTAGLLARGIFLSSYEFSGQSEFQWALCGLLAFLIAVYGAWSRFRQPLAR